MKVTIKCYGLGIVFGKTPEKTIELDEGCTAGFAADVLGLNREEIGLIIRNGTKITEDTKLSDKDTLVIIGLIEGG